MRELNTSSAQSRINLFSDELKKHEELKQLSLTSANFNKQGGETKLLKGSLSAKSLAPIDDEVNTPYYEDKKLLADENIVGETQSNDTKYFAQSRTKSIEEEPTTNLMTKVDFDVTSDDNKNLASHNIKVVELSH